MTNEIIWHDSRHRDTIISSSSPPRLSTAEAILSESFLDEQADLSIILLVKEKRQRRWSNFNASGVQIMAICSACLSPSTSLSNKIIQWRKSDRQEQTSALSLDLFIRVFLGEENRQNWHPRYSSAPFVFRFRPSDHESNFLRRRWTRLRRQSIDLAVRLSISRPSSIAEDFRRRSNHRALPGCFDLSRTWNHLHLNLSKTKVKPRPRVSRNEDHERQSRLVFVEKRTPARYSSRRNRTCTVACIAIGFGCFPSRIWACRWLTFFSWYWSVTIRI